jgi:hypothetical protein
MDSLGVRSIADLEATRFERYAAEQLELESALCGV